MINKIKYENHEEWLEIRAKYIGGSDAAAVVGLNPYKSAYTLWAEKTGKLAAFEGNITTRVGAYLEDLVAKLFEEDTGKKVHKSNFTYVNDDFPFACANVDRIVNGESALLEIKTTNSFPNMKKIRGGEFPDAYYVQMVHYMAVLGLERAYLAILVNSREFYVFSLDRDEEEISALMQAEKSFWEYVTNGKDFPIDGSSSSSDTLAALYPASGEGEIDLTPLETELRQYLELGDQIKTLKNLQDESANKVKAYMAEVPKGTSNNYKVSYASSERKTFDSKKFAAEHPEMTLDEFYKVSNFRTFKITEIKK